MAALVHQTVQVDQEGMLTHLDIIALDEIASIDCTPEIVKGDFGCCLTMQKSEPGGWEMVDKARFELATSALRRQRSTGLIYLPK